MHSESKTQSQFESLQAGLELIGTLEEEVDDSTSQLETARVHLAQAGQKVDTAGFDRQFSKAMGLIASVAVSNGHDELAEDALQLGGDEI
jgi:hypothetical protein